MLSKSIVRIIPALALLSALGMSNVAFANNQAKLALAKKAVIAGEVSPYATPDLKKVLQQAHAIDDRSNVWLALLACNVPRHKCPVSAKAMACSMVSVSRISPIKITSGAWRSVFFRA